jgi:hypothetical protein
VLLGRPLPAGGGSHHAPTPRGVADRPRRSRNGLIGMALAAVGIVALVLGRRGAKQ